MKFNSLRQALAEAEAAIAAKDIVAASQIYRELAAAFPENKEVQSRTAEGLLACGHWTDAIAILLKALEQAPISPMILLRLTYAYDAAGQPANAAEYLQRFADRVPGDGEPWLNLGDLYRRAGNFERALASYSHVLELEPLNLTAIVGRGDVLLAIGRSEEALVDYQRADAIQPGNAEVLFKLAGLALARSEPREAVEYLQRSLAANSRDPATWANLSLTLSQLGLFEDAARVAEQGLGLDDGSRFCMYALGVALVGLAQFDKAADLLRSAAQAGPENIPILEALADAETGREEFYAAERAWQQILVADPAHRVARFMIGALHGEAIRDMAPEIAAEIFAEEADRYDEWTVPAHGYDAPAQIVSLIEKTFPEHGSFERVLDLGCGTGLIMAGLRDAFRVDFAMGIDISPRMLHVAARKAVYDEVVNGDAVASTNALAEMDFDLITAVELAPYLGSLEPLLATVRNHLVVGGIFAVSIEVSAGPAQELKRTGRFAHGIRAVEAAGRAAGLELVASEEFKLHEVRGRHTNGCLMIFQRP